jgi:hypothetical protein
MGLPDALMLQWLADIRSAPADRFIALKDANAIPPEIRLSSKGWFESVLQQEANPYLPANRARHSYSPATETTPDILRHDYNARGVPVRALETRNAILLTTRLATGDLRRQVQSMADLLLRMQDEGYRLEFQYGAVTGSKFYFTSNPERDVARLRFWHDRVDGIAEPGAVTFLFYKKVEQLLAYQDDRHWFGESFRRQP